MYLYLIFAILGSASSLASLEYITCGLFLVACAINLFVNFKYKEQEINAIREAVERIQMRAIRENAKREQNA